MKKTEVGQKFTLLGSKPTDPESGTWAAKGRRHRPMTNNSSKRETGLITVIYNGLRSEDEAGVSTLGMGVIKYCSSILLIHSFHVSNKNSAIGGPYN
jgi:hypothetical protein